jgi:COMPASS component SWD3
MTLGES